MKRQLTKKSSTKTCPKLTKQSARFYDLRLGSGEGPTLTGQVPTQGSL